MIGRRAFLAGAAMAQGRRQRLKLGVMDGVLRMPSKPEAVAAARSHGLDGLQVTLGREMQMANPDVQPRLLAEAATHGVTINATYIDILHVHCLKSDPKARDLVAQGIDITRRLRAPILMTVFFGKCALETRREQDAVADVFKELAPEAERAGVILGYENLLTAEDNARAMDRVGSRAFKIYYDVGNATNLVGADAAREIRFLGRDRICQFHFKDRGFLGEGKVDFRGVLAAVADIGFEGYANLETSTDLARNLEYLRGLMRA